MKSLSSCTLKMSLATEEVWKDEERPLLRRDRTERVEKADTLDKFIVAVSWLPAWAVAWFEQLALHPLAINGRPLVTGLASVLLARRSEEALASSLFIWTFEWSLHHCSHGRVD